MIFDRKFFVLSPEFFALKCFSIFIEKFAVFHGFSMFFNGLLKTGVFFYTILGLNMLFLCVLPCDFGVVSDDIRHCSGFVWLLFVCKNDRKSCDFSVKTLCFISFQCDYWQGNGEGVC